MKTVILIRVLVVVLVRIRLILVSDRDDWVERAEVSELFAACLLDCVCVCVCVCVCGAVCVCVCVCGAVRLLLSSRQRLDKAI